VMPLATSTFLQVMFGVLIVVPVILLWVAALVDVIGRHSGGLKIAAILVLILIVPILGPILYFAFRGPAPAASAADAEAAYRAAADLHHEQASRPVGGTSLYR
jgi:hypothetical protein